MTAGALGAYLALEGTAALNPAGTLRFGDVRLNGLGLCIVAAGFAALAAMAVRFARRRRDPSGMLAAALTVAPYMLVACLYVFSALLLGHVQALLAFGTIAITMVVTVLTLARVSSTLAS